MFKGLSLITIALLVACANTGTEGAGKASASTGIKTELVTGQNGQEVWVDPELVKQLRGGRAPAKIWFKEQFLGDGDAYERRAGELSGWTRSELRESVVTTLKSLSNKYFKAAEKEIGKLLKEGKIMNLREHWIINGFSCVVTKEGLEALKKTPGVKNIFHGTKDMLQYAGSPSRGRMKTQGPTFVTESSTSKPFDPDKYEQPWNLRDIMAVKTWKELNINGKGVLNVVHDFGFLLDTPTISDNLWRNPNEIPDNGQDDDENGYIDDYHGYNFATASPAVNTPQIMRYGGVELLHGNICVGIICGTGTEDCKTQVGIAPESKWIPVISSMGNIEEAIEWAIEHKADTYSMSFSWPGLGELRSHYRKIMEHGSFCGVYFTSGAGNFASRRQYAPIPVQMRIPEDIPNAVFSAAGIDNHHQRPGFSSQGPVEWKTEHYDEGKVGKPDFAGFNKGFPTIDTKGGINNDRNNLVQGNSFAGPHLCGVLALMLSADMELLPWDAMEILRSTSVDILSEGFDHQSGHGLLNAYRAVKETLRRKAVRLGENASVYEGREEGDEPEIKSS